MEQKKLYRSRENRIIAGVCGGVGEYFGVDPNIIRLGCIIFAATGAGALVYIAAAIILPDQI